MNMLYCIKHDQMVKSYHGVITGLFHLHTVQMSNSQDPGERFDVMECDFEDGWATVPPPPFDMDAFAETAEPELTVDIVGYDYDVDTDQIVTEVLNA